MTTETAGDRPGQAHTVPPRTSRVARVVLVAVGLAVGVPLWLAVSSNVIFAFVVSDFGPIATALSVAFGVLPSVVGCLVWVSARREGRTVLRSLSATVLLVIVWSLPGAAMSPVFWISVIDISGHLPANG